MGQVSGKNWPLTKKVDQLMTINNACIFSALYSCYLWWGGGVDSEANLAIMWWDSVTSNNTQYG